MRTTVKFCLVALMCISTVACKRSRENSVQPFTGTNAISGDWTMSKYNGSVLLSTQKGSITNVAFSTTQGTAHFDMTMDTMSHQVENATYTLANGNTRVTFTKNDGNYNTLASGGVWSIDSLTSHIMVLRSQYNLVMRFTK